MMQIVPTVTAENPHVYRSEIENVADFAKRIHIDLADGVFAPTKLISPVQAWWPGGVTADVHFMYQKPKEHIETIISLQPDLVVLHAEADGVAQLIDALKSVEIKAGVALLPETKPEDVENLITEADHVLIFGGKLGYHGGNAQLDNLEKVARVKQINPDAELSWDGGINDENIAKLAEAGIDVANVGGYIQKASSPQDAYDILVGKVNQ